MKYHFKICYEMDMPLAIAVAVYLDAEHYIFLHKSLTASIEVLKKGLRYYKCHQTWNVFGITFGQTYICEYRAPATFINHHLRPHPEWLPSIHHVIKTKTMLRYYENPDSKTTLSELSVQLDIPFWLYPFRKIIEGVFRRIKILKDLEDVALVDRRAKLFGRFHNAVYLKKSQFLLHKDDYVKHFGENCEILNKSPAMFRKERWTDIRDLNFSYVKNFLKNDYVRFANFYPHQLASSQAELAAPLS
ncbi:MAG: hypothetical protein EXS63_01210 [Candidatus Omnitrophica bacterium]|nr:hypothetical protein [Candidatus Omnitrophota bacterium]